LSVISIEIIIIIIIIKCFFVDAPLCTHHRHTYPRGGFRGGPSRPRPPLTEARPAGRDQAGDRAGGPIGRPALGRRSGRPVDLGIRTNRRQIHTLGIIVLYSSKTRVAYVNSGADHLLPEHDRRRSPEFIAIRGRPAAIGWAAG